jgi:hypothetical protein
MNAKSAAVTLITVLTATLLVAGPAQSLAATHSGFSGGGSHSYAGHSGGYGGHYGGYGGHYGGGYYGHGYGGWRGGGYYPGWHGYYGGWGWHGGYYGWRGYGGWGWWGWPAGVFLATLPLYYSTLWWNGVPYYYVDDSYYIYSNSANGYVAVSPPPNASAPSSGPASPEAPYAGPASTDLFAYPKNSQSDAQVAQDRQQCQAWAASQSGATNRADNLRAQTACLEARGYSVR